MLKPSKKEIDKNPIVRGIRHYLANHEYTELLVDLRFFNRVLKEIAEKGDEAGFYEQWILGDGSTIECRDTLDHYKHLSTEKHWEFEDRHLIHINNVYTLDSAKYNVIRLELDKKKVLSEVF